MKVTEKSSILQASYRFWSIPKIPPENLVSHKTDRSNTFKLWQIGITLAATSGVIFSGNSAIAQIVPDRTLGAESSVVTPNVDIKGVSSDRIDAGAIRGANLFHSFQEFNIREGRGAYFSNPAGIENIFSRVTGNNVSNINGKLGVLGNANLFLLNPNGIIFGPNASLDLNGSFLGSTGNSFNFGNGEEFSANNPTAPPLLSVSVPLGVQFNQEQPSAIANFGNLSVGTEQNLNLMGGTVVSTGQLSAPGGQVAVASVPGGSVVNLSPSAQFLNIETSSPVTSVGSSSLSELLTSVDERQRPGLTVNSNGQVELTGSGLPVVDGDVVAKNVTAQTATLTANNNLTLVENQLGTTGDLNLLARDTVRVRDSVNNPFVAQAGGQLLVQGRQGVDIFALNHPSSGLLSGGDMVLRSLNTVGGDAHYWAGGNFRIEQMDGSLGGLFSPYDPIIRASGDVSFASYEGASLHILAGGSVTIRDTVTITGADGTNGLVETVFLSDDDPNGNRRSFVDIDGRNSPTLDIRAGVRADAIGTPEFTPVPFPGVDNNGNENNIFPNSPNITPDISDDTRRNGANITIGSIVNRGIQGQVVRGQVFLTNQYEPNLDLPGGSIEITGGIPAPDDPAPDDPDLSLGFTSIAAYGNDVTIDARGDVTIARNIITGSGGDIGGNVNILSGRNIDTTGGRIISLSSRLAGDVTLSATGDIRSGNIEASSNTDDLGFSTIRLESLQGSVILDRVQLSTSNPDGYDFAGNIEISAGKDVNITGNRVLDADGNETGDINLISNGYFGIVNIEAGGNVIITNSLLSAETPRRDYVNESEEPKSRSGEMKVISRTGEINISNSSLSTTTGSSKADPGSIFLTAENGKVLIQDSSNITNTIQIRSGGVGDNTSPEVNIRGNSVEILGNSFVDTRNNGFGKGADIAITATNGGSIKIQNSGLDAAASNSANGGNISLNTSNGGSIELENSTIFTDTFGSGKGGDLNITAENGLIKLNSFIPPETEYFTGEATLVATVNKGENERPDASGRGGNINLQARNVVLENGAKIQTRTDGTPEPNNPDKNAQAGNITVNVQDSVTMSGNSELNAKTTGSANAGSVEIQANELIIQGGSRATASSEGSGKAGDVSVGANSVLLRGTNPNTDFRKIFENNQTPKEGLLAEATNGGTAGTLIIFADELRIENGAAATVSSPNGQAGNLVVFAKEIFLNNGALLATTGREGSEPRANIFLLGNEGNETTLVQSVVDLLLLISNKKLGEQGKKSLPGSPLDFLILGNESLIETNAVNSANGGNIAIKTRLLIALPPTGKNGNDISANALATGNGGVVAIDPRPLGIYGTEFRPKTQNISLNEITASSEQGLQGTVVIVPINVDPKRGILQLPEDLGDSSRLITQSCPVGKTQAGSSFIVTGRGGLPPSPSSALSSDALMGTTTNASPRETRLMQSSSPSSTLVEAKGVNIGPKGEIIFTANPSKPTSDNSWQRNTRCNAQ
ncbi:filamentous hemagglutinin N-terminal domain-containing protein [Nostoc sp. FACHB-133]|uniref:two-partner secretion domain-containing protein n=1 Tax=Nostoc sp. FACHB-133 TaxID=2692835 RepID=UPI001687990F|nr:filamentous hemagglutinin N-terminal domain-containing protein [Nostoc sp. FACHB-133]MBD2526471.1 filamentous hemagglutinin N-terminal domain-containing protein [Nostoc sp. FACHB-133]